MYQGRYMYIVNCRNIYGITEISLSLIISTNSTQILPSHYGFTVTVFHSVPVFMGTRLSPSYVCNVIVCVLCVYLQVGDKGQSSGSGDISSLQQQSQSIQTSINELEQQLLLAKQRHKRIALDQQISGEFMVVLDQMIYIVLLAMK